MSGVHAQDSALPTGIPTPAAPAALSEAVPPEAVAAVARELNCPLCQGYNLQDCPLTVCAQMRELIAQQLAAGQTADEIKAGFVADYGPQVLNAPPTRGIYLTAWVLPVVILALGALGLVWFWRRAARRGGGAATLAAATGSGSADAAVADAERMERLERLVSEDDA